VTSFLDFPGLKKRMALEPHFGIELLKMAERLNLDPDSILSVMSIETAGTFDPSIQNPQNPNADLRATGLIQFMPTTAKGLGTSIPALRAMTAVEQLQYVERFFESVGGRIRRDFPGDYYMAVFMPAFVGREQEMVLGRANDATLLAGLKMSAIYDQNKGFDRSKRCFFTVGDVWQTTLSRIASAKTRPPIEVTAPGPLAPAEPLHPSPSLGLPWQSSGGRFDLPVLKIGARGTAVTLAQLLAGADIANGIFTLSFANYVKLLQSAHGLTPDGFIGPLTWELLAHRKPSALKVPG